MSGGMWPWGTGCYQMDRWAMVKGGCSLEQGQQQIWLLAMGHVRGPYEHSPESHRNTGEKNTDRE